MHAPNPYAPPSTPYVPFHADTGFGARLASRSARFRAWVLDVLLTGGIMLPGFLFSAPSQDDGSVFMGISIIAMVVFWIYQWWLVSTQGQTLGKRWTGIRIVKVDGGPLGFVSGVLMRSWLMSAIGSIPFIGGFASVLDLLMIFGSERRCLHDHMAGTMVVEA